MAWGSGQESEAIHSFIPLNGFSPLSAFGRRDRRPRPDLGGSWHACALMGAREEEEEAKDC